MLTDRLRSWIADPTPPQSLPLPAVEAPPLHDLKVTVPPLPPDRELTEELLLARYVVRVRELAPRRTREVGERAEPGDDVFVRMAFFGPQGAVPRTARPRFALVAGDAWLVPGLGEGLVGATPVERIDAPCRFPDDWEVPALRGVAGIYRMRVLQVDALTLPPDPDDPDFLRQLGVDLSIPEMMEQLRQEYVDELTAEVRQQARDMVFDLLRTRSPVEVPSELVERELFERWARDEGSVLLDLGGGEADLNTSFAAWLRDTDLREQVRRRVHVGLLLGAIAKRDHVELTEADLEARLAEVCEPLGLTPEQAKIAVRESPRDAERFVQEAYHLAIADHVMAQAAVRYREPR